MAKLNPEILSIIERKTGKKENSIRHDISIMRRTNAKLPLNVVAHLYALKNGFSVLQKLAPAEKAVVPNTEFEKPLRLVKTQRRADKKRVIEFIKYATSNVFLSDHIVEINRAYTARCYTATFILCRKIIENLLIEEILKRKFPQKDKATKELYYDFSQNRNKDLKYILDNLKKHAQDFGTDKALVEKIVHDSKAFKDDANDKAHSLYHLVKSPKELDDANVQGIIDMISQLKNNIP